MNPHQVKYYFYKKIIKFDKNELLKIKIFLYLLKINEKEKHFLSEKVNRSLLHHPPPPLF